MTKEKEDIDFKIGSKEMAYWNDVISGREHDIEASESNLTYFNAILDMAKEKYKEAEKEWKKETEKKSETTPSTQN